MTIFIRALAFRALAFRARLETSSTSIIPYHFENTTLLILRLLYRWKKNKTVNSTEISPLVCPNSPEIHFPKRY